MDAGRWTLGDGRWAMDAGRDVAIAGVLRATDARPLVPPASSGRGYQAIVE